VLFQKSEALPNYLHPAELTTLKDIQKLSSEYKEIWKFALKYQNIIDDSEREAGGNELAPGLYLQAFADGIIDSLQVFQKSVVELEKKYLKKPNYSLVFIYSELEKVVFCGKSLKFSRILT
jgi:gamma-tubulin complex component 4